VNKAEAHLSAADPVLGALIERLAGQVETIEARRGRRPADYYAGLVRTIVGQQLSTIVRTSPA